MVGCSVRKASPNAGEKDGKGWIATITFDKAGKPIVTKLVDGLNAPKGLRSQKGTLWVTDIDEVLKALMEKHGFVNYDQEWWHYTLKNEPYPDTYFDFVIK